MNMMWLMRMKRWAQHPPSPRRVKFILAVIAICLILVGYEYVFGWPEALTLEGNPSRRVPKF